MMIVLIKSHEEAIPSSAPGCFQMPQVIVSRHWTRQL
jgi:hypothetical protein